jgi:membrane-associated phospholipid phosphatase
MAEAGSKVADRLIDADARTAEAVRPHRRSWPVRALEPIADLGDQPPMRALCAAVIAAGLAGGDRRLAKAGLAMLAAHTLASAGKNFVKRRIDRTRPRSSGKRGKDHRPSPGRSEAKEETSFPSGHAAGAAAVARAFARSYPEHAGPAYAAAGIIALAQIPRCAHYPTDVGAGLAIGLAAEAAVDAAARLLESRASPA